MRHLRIRTGNARGGSRSAVTPPTPPAPAITLVLNGDSFSWAWNADNPPEWRLWKIPSEFNPTTDDFQNWRNLASDSDGVEGDRRVLSLTPVSGFSYALCGYDDNDDMLPPASNVIAVP